MSAQQPTNPNRLPPVTAATRQRLQQVFDHAQRSAEKGDRDYAHDLYAQCLVDDPANLIFLQQLLNNLAQKFGNNKKGARFAALKTKTSRMALTKAAGKGQWREAFQAACDALKQNPWETATLLDVASAYEDIGSDECQLYTLRWALDAAPKDVTVNRRAAIALARLGQFDQAISCWRRVEQAKPGDEEASKSISQLSVEQTIQKGGYNQELLHGAASGGNELETAMRAKSANYKPEGTSASPAAEASDAKDKDKDNSGQEQALLDAIQTQPAEVSNYVQLADLFAAQNRLREVEEILTRALAVSGGGDLAIRERLEDVHLRRAQQQLQVAQRRAEQDKTPEAADLARRMVAQANQAELEVYAVRAARNPSNLLLQFELGMRCKRAGKFKEAIQAFQAAREDVRHKAMVQLHLGESFQHIKQFKLALTAYEAAIDAADSMQLDTRKLALYRAGVLAIELKDADRAEKYLTELAGMDFGYRDVADRLDKLAALRDSV
jgi:regulator of sirC expression with transglutaminase-like and TPR domain